MGSERAYHSPTREKQADQTRRSIAAAARKLLLRTGFSGTTIDAIAGEAGVSPQTVYAVFGSKQGILAEIIDQARFSDRYATLLKEALSTTDPEARLRYAGRIARQIFDSERAELELLRGAGVVSPELAAMEEHREESRYKNQAGMIDYMVQSKRLKSGVDVAMGRDILWALTSRELYRSLVVGRGWSSDRYESELGNLLVAALLSPEKSRKASPRRKT